MATTIKTYKGDTAPNLTFTITRTDGTIVDLTGCTVRFKIQDPVTGILTNSDLNNTCSIVSPATGGVVRYAWNSTDLPDTGTYTGNLVIHYPTVDPENNPQKETFGVTIQVSDTV